MKALVLKSSSRGLGSKSEDGADGPSVVLDESVKFEDMIEFAYEEVEA